MGWKNKGEDRVDLVLDQWRKVSPERDTTPMAIFTRLLRLSKLYTRYISKVMVRHGLQVGEFDLLSTIYRSGREEGLTPNELCDFIVLSPGAMTNKLDRLEGAGLVQRVPDHLDRRSIRIQLTEAGRTTTLDALDDYLETLHKLQAGLSDRQKADLAGGLKSLLMILEEDHDSKL